MGILSAVCLIALVFPYIYTIFKGNTRPNSISWAGWGLLSAIAASAQFAVEISWSLLIPLITALNCFIIAHTMAVNVTLYLQRRGNRLLVLKLNTLILRLFKKD